MRNKLKSMLDIWKDAGFIVQFTLSSGDVVTGHLKDIDSDEVLVEPEYEGGGPGPLTVVMLHHVVAATYYDEPAEVES
jgi:hypothetical protein